jgi:hypothetical protein
MKENYFYNFMIYCLARLNLSESFVSQDKKNKILTYLRYGKSQGFKINLREIERIINNESV